jgi:hypothetical protein
MKGHFTPSADAEDHTEGVEITNMNMIEGYDNPALVISDESTDVDSCSVDIQSPPPYEEKAGSSSGSSKDGKEPESSSSRHSSGESAPTIPRVNSQSSLTPESIFSRRLRLASVAMNLELEGLQEEEDEGLFQNTFPIY